MHIIMQAMIEWAEEVNAKAKPNIEKAQSKQKREFDAKHKPPTFKWEIKCGFTIHGRT